MFTCILTYIHTYIGNKIFVSVGDEAPMKEKASAMMKAQAFLTKEGMPMRTQICRVIVGQKIKDPTWAACFPGAA